MLYVGESNIKTGQRTYFFRKGTYILLVNDHDEIAIAIPSINKTVSTNYPAN